MGTNQNLALQLEQDRPRAKTLGLEVDPERCPGTHPVRLAWRAKVARAFEATREAMRWSPAHVARKLGLSRTCIVQWEDPTTPETPHAADIEALGAAFAQGYRERIAEEHADEPAPVSSCLHWHFAVVTDENGDVAKLLRQLPPGVAPDPATKKRAVKELTELIGAAAEMLRAVENMP